MINDIWLLQTSSYCKLSALLDFAPHPLHLHHDHGSYSAATTSQYKGPVRQIALAVRAAQTLFSPYATSLRILLPSQYADRRENCG